MLEHRPYSLLFLVCFVLSENAYVSTVRMWKSVRSPVVSSCKQHISCLHSRPRPCSPLARRCTARGSPSRCAGSFGRPVASHGTDATRHVVRPTLRAAHGKHAPCHPPALQHPGDAPCPLRFCDVSARHEVAQRDYAARAGAGSGEMLSARSLMRDTVREALERQPPRTTLQFCRKPVSVYNWRGYWKSTDPTAAFRRRTMTGLGARGIRLRKRFGGGR